MNICMVSLFAAGRTPSHMSEVSHSAARHSTGDSSSDVMVVEVSSLTTGAASTKFTPTAASVKFEFTTDASRSTSPRSTAK